MRAERSTRVIQRRNKPRNTQIVIIRRFRRKLCVIPLPFELFLRSNAPFTALGVQNVVHVFPNVETSLDTRKSRSFVDIDQN